METLTETEALSIGFGGLTVDGLMIPASEILRIDGGGSAPMMPDTLPDVKNNQPLVTFTAACNPKQHIAARMTFTV